MAICGLDVYEAPLYKVKSLNVILETVHYVMAATHIHLVRKTDRHLYRRLLPALIGEHFVDAFNGRIKVHGMKN
eukprot:XP_001709112.1 Hypothetical protein GL50803_39038 [Giardia lamblia ATCC 50803]